MPKPFVFVGMPHSGLVHIEAAHGLFIKPSRGGFTYTFYAARYSILTWAFNHLWATALNGRDKDGLTHFAMIHSDIEPQDGWGDVLLAELIRLDADLVSAVVPLKNQTGLTSTAVEEANGVRRLTIREVARLPETFGTQDVGGRPLLLNTGLFLCDLRKPWAERVCFTIPDEIRRGPDGLWQMHASPEDWNFSRFLNAQQCRIFATRKVEVRHHGDYSWSNQGAWGDWDRDREYPG